VSTASSVSRVKTNEDGSSHESDDVSPTVLPKSNVEQRKLEMKKQLTPTQLADKIHKAKCDTLTLDSVLHTKSTMRNKGTNKACSFLDEVNSDLVAEGLLNIVQKGFYTISGTTRVGNAVECYSITFWISFHCSQHLSL
jgi:hypothetical protein